MIYNNYTFIYLFCCIIFGIAYSAIIFDPPVDICIGGVDNINHCCLCNGCNNTQQENIFTPNNTYTPSDIINTSNFGSSLSLSPNGLLIAIDTLPNLVDQTISDNTTVYIFDIEEEDFYEIDSTPPSMGHYLHMSNNFVAIGSSNEFNQTVSNFVSLYVKTVSPPWSNLFDIPHASMPVINTTSFGSELHINSNETLLFISIPELDIIQVYDTTFGIFQFNITYPGSDTNNAQFGYKISSSRDHFAVSAPFGNTTNGCIYIYNLPFTNNGTSSPLYDQEICNNSNDTVNNYGFGANFHLSDLSLSMNNFSTLAIGYNNSDLIEIYTYSGNINITTNESYIYHQSILNPDSPPVDSIKDIHIDSISNRIVASNSRFPSSISARGKIFTYEYSNSSDTWVPCQTISDINTSFDTRFGQNIYTHNNILVVSIPDTDSDDNDIGSIRLFNLSREESCVGCDNIINSCNITDECNICGGDNSTCEGCDGIPNSGLVFDVCGVCGGNSDTCIFITSIIDFIPNTDVSNNFTINATCTIPSYAIPIAEPLQNSPFIWNITMQPSMGTAVFDPDDDDDSTPEFVDDDDEVFKYLTNDLSPSTFNDSFIISVTDSFGNMNSTTIFVNIQPCIGCDNVTNSGMQIDQCGICGGNGTSCLDCNNEPNGTHIIDYCNVCVLPSNANETCVDVFDRSSVIVNCLSSIQIHNVSWEPGFPDSRMHWDIISPLPTHGSASIHDLDGIITYTHTGTTNNTDTVFFEGEHPNDQIDQGSVNITIVGCGPVGCDGIPGSGSVVDMCGVCNGIDSCVDCNGTPFGNATIDMCGICNGNNSCTDCNGVPFGTDEIDQCGVCGGDNSSCTDCNNVINGNSTLDICNVCDGNGTSCLDCNGVPFGGSEIDQCGICGGNNACVDCSGVPFGNSTEDVCGTCNGNITDPDECPSISTGLIIGLIGGVVGLCSIIACCFIIFLFSGSSNNNNNGNDERINNNYYLPLQTINRGIDDITYDGDGNTNIDQNNNTFYLIPKKRKRNKRFND